MCPTASPAARPGWWWKARETLERGPAGQWKWPWLAINGREMMSPPVKERHTNDFPLMSPKSGKIKYPLFRCECGFGLSVRFRFCHVWAQLRQFRSCYWSHCQILNIKNVTFSMFEILSMSNVSWCLSGSDIYVAPSLHCKSGSYWSRLHATIVQKYPELRQISVSILLQLL